MGNSVKTPIGVFPVWIIVVLVAGAGAWAFNAFEDVGYPGPWSLSMSDTGGGATPGGTTPGGVVPTHAAAQLQWSARDGIVKTTITTADVDIFVASSAGTFDFLNRAENVAANSAPEQGTQFMSEGAKIILHVEDDADPAGGEDYYDQWYYVNGLGEGADVKKLTPAQLAGTPGAYTLVDTGVVQGQAHWTAGTTNYWDLGMLDIIPRTDDASLDQSMFYKSTLLSTMTDGATEVDTSAELSSASPGPTLSDDIEDLTIMLVCDTNSLAYGVPLYSIGVDGTFESRSTYMFISTNATAISASHMASQGWYPCNRATMYAESLFYKKVPAIIPSSGSAFSESFTFPMDISACTGSLVYGFKFYMNDCVLDSLAPIGQPGVAIPGTYGVAGYGIAAINNDETITVSSGAGATQTLYCLVTAVA